MTGKRDHWEPAIALALGACISLLISPRALSLVVAGTFPAVVLTASSQRPPVASVGEAYRIGTALKQQVNFWFGILLWGSLATLSLFVAHTLDWRLVTWRPPFIPTWIPADGGRWLTFAAASLTSLTALRVSHVASEIRSVVDLSTREHTVAIEAARTADDAEARDRLQFKGPSRDVLFDRRAS